MAINQSQSKILRICLFVALLVALTDAASLRGSNEIEEVVEDSEEDFYQMIVDEPFETKNEEEPGFYETYVEPLFTTHDAPEDEIDTGRNLQQSWFNFNGFFRRNQQPPILVQPPPQYFAGGGGGGGGGGIPLRSQVRLPVFQSTNVQQARVGYPNYAAFGRPVGITGRPVGITGNTFFPELNGGGYVGGYGGYNYGPSAYLDPSRIYGSANIRNPAVASYVRPAPSTNAQGVEYATGNFAKTPANGYFDNLSF